MIRCVVKSTSTLTCIAHAAPKKINFKCSGIRKYIPHKNSNTDSEKESSYLFNLAF